MRKSQDVVRSGSVRGSAPPGRAATPSGRVSARHECAARGCKEQIRLDLLMCRGHWWKVPASLRAKVWSFYKMRFEDLRGYLDAVQEAVDAVAEREAYDQEATP